jgi:hypothetical protein
VTLVVKKKRYILLVLGSILLALVALSPFLLSSSSALHFFIAAVNRNISGKLSIDSWLIGWQQGVLCQNVVYANPEKGIMVSVPSLTSNRGLMELVLAPKNFGIVHAESPVVELSGPAIRDFFAQGKTGASEAGIHAAGNEVPVWDRVFVDLKSRGGQVKIGLGEQGRTVDLKNVSVDSTLAAGVAAFEIRFQAMEQGFVEASGTLNLPAHEYGWLETIIADTAVKVSSLQVRELLRAAAAVSRLPQGEGVLDADFKFKVVGLDVIDYSGLAELSNCTLHGGFLGDDQPSLQKVRLAVEEGGWTTHGWRLKGFELVSDTLSMQASGKVSPETTQLAAQGIVNLPVLFDQVPRLLGVNEATFLESGTVEFTVDLPGAPDPGIKLKAKAGQIGGIFQDQPFFWDSPVSLLLNGEKKGASLQVSALQFEAPFARAKGSGGLHSFAMEAVLDLERALADIGTLFQFDLTGSGKMDLTMKSGPAENDRFTVSGDLDISDFMLLRHGQSLIPRHQFSLIGSLTAPDAFADRRQGEWDIQLALSSWLGEVFLAMDGEKTGGQPFKGYFTTDSELDLARTTSLLHAMNILDSETRMGGTLQMQAAGFAGHSPVEIRDLSAEVTNFILEGNGAHFAEPRITLATIQPVNEEVPFLSLRELKVVADKETFFRSGAGLNLLDISARQVTLHNVQLQAQAVTATVDRLMIPDWRKPSNGLLAQFSAATDLGRMTEAFQAVGLLSGETFFSGSAQAAFLLAEKDRSNQEMGMNVRVAGFGLKHRDTVLIDGEDMDFSARLQGRAPSGAMTVDELQLRSDTLALDVTGTISEPGTTQVLELSGSIEPDLESVATFSGRLFDLDLRMEGRPKERIAIRYPLRRKPDDSAGRLSVLSAIHADRLVINGMELRNVTMPFHVDDRNLHMDLSGRLNEGRFELVTDTDFTGKPAVLTIPGSGQVMTGVKLDDSLVSHLLANIHPLFGGLAVPSGLIDVRLDSLWWPIGKKGASPANFVVIVDAREIVLESGIQLKNILALFGLEKEKLQLRDTEIYCIGNNGRIKCSPVRVMAGGAEIIIGGSVGMDRSLDYEVEVPVTNKLVRDEESEVPPGETVKVAVKGTSEKPIFDRQTVLSAIQGSMQRAAAEAGKKKQGQKN